MVRAGDRGASGAGNVARRSWRSRSARIAVVLGSSEAWAGDWSRLQADFGWTGAEGEVDLIAINQQIADFPGAVKFSATLHPEKLEGWASGRDDRQEIVAPALGFGVTWVEYPWAGWTGTSGLYAVQLALQAGYEKVMLCGVGIDERKHFHGADEEQWRSLLGHYREGWIAAKPELLGKVFSGSGWTKELLGGWNG